MTEQRCTDEIWLKKDAHFILKQLNIHSPLWAKLLKLYIRELEKKVSGK